jgi:hypothetical protein
MPHPSTSRNHWTNQDILKGEISLYRWPPVWLVWISLFCKLKLKLSVVIQLIPKQSNWQSNRRSMVQRYFPLQHSLDKLKNLTNWGPSLQGIFFSTQDMFRHLTSDGAPLLEYKSLLQQKVLLYLSCINCSRTKNNPKWLKQGFWLRNVFPLSKWGTKPKHQDKGPML